VPSSGSLNLAAAGAAPGIVLTWTPPAGPVPAPALGPGAAPRVGPVTLSALTISPASFSAAPRGPSALAAAKHRSGAKVAYTLDQAAAVTFTIIRLQPKRRAKPRVILPGAFTRPGAAGANSFRFSGRLAGKGLAPGSYRLLATPTTGGKTGQSAASFRIVGPH
jgi:hypothetical protein